MSSFAEATAAPARTKSLVWPREHGAWAILLVPLVTGAAVAAQFGTRLRDLVLFALAALALFLLRTPVEALLGATPMRVQGPAERRAVTRFAVAFAAVAVVALALLFLTGENYQLLYLGLAAAIAFALQAWLRRLGRDTRMNSQMVGAIGLTSTAAGAYYTLSGQLDQQALVLWLLNWLFAANQIHFVQVRIHSGRAGEWRQKLRAGRGFLVSQCVLLLGVVFLATIGLVPGLVALAFIPLLARGFAWFMLGPEPLRVHRLGVTELAHAIAFGILLPLAFRLSG